MAFVYRRQQRIENRRARFPDLIEKNNFSFRKIAGGQTFVAPFIFQRLNGEWAKDLFRRGETGHQVFKCTSLLEGELEATGNQAFGDPRRAQQKNALAAEGGKQAKAYCVAAFEESFFQRGAEPGNSFCQ